MRVLDPAASVPLELEAWIDDAEARLARLLTALHRATACSEITNDFHPALVGALVQRLRDAAEACKQASLLPRCAARNNASRTRKDDAAARALLNWAYSSSPRAEAGDDGNCVTTSRDVHALSKAWVACNEAAARRRMEDGLLVLLRQSLLADLATYQRLFESSLA